MSKSAGIKLESVENVNLGVQTSGLGSVPDVVKAEIPIIERNYNTINFHVRMSDRNLAVIRRRTENLRKKDTEIRERLEKVRLKAKMVAECSPARQEVIFFQGANMISRLEPGSEKDIAQPKLSPVTSSHNETALDCGQKIDSFVKHETQDVLHGIPGYDEEVYDVVSSENRVSSQTEAGNTQHDEQLRQNIECDAISVENCGHQLKNKVYCDTTHVDSTSECGNGRVDRPVPAKRLMKRSLVSSTKQENMTSKSPIKRVTNAPVNEEPVTSRPAKLKSFVGERYVFDKIKITTSCTCDCVKEADFSTAKRTSLSTTHRHSLDQMASPTSLGVSPVRLQLHKSAKKTRMVSMLRSPLVGSMKMTVTKTILNVLKKDRRTSLVF